MTWRIAQREVGRLAKAPLRLALVQARTVPMLAFEQPTEVQRLVDDLGEGWTIIDRQVNREVSLQVGPGGVQQQTAPPETVWVLAAPDDGATRAAVSSSSVAVECDRYDYWGPFREAIAELFGAVQRIFKPRTCLRLGARYINELHDERADGVPARLAELVNEALIAPALEFGRPVRGSLAELRVAEDEQGVFTLRHGLTKPGVYLLDFDAYREVPDPFDAAALTKRAEGFHARIESVFAWTLNDDYLTELQTDQSGDASE